MEGTGEKGRETGREWEGENKEEEGGEERREKGKRVEVHIERGGEGRGQEIWIVSGKGREDVGIGEGRNGRERSGRKSKGKLRGEEGNKK